MTTSRLASIQAGDELPSREFTPDNIQLMMYNAALWNAHLIHYDLPYATEVEGYPGLVTPGPLLGDWLSQCVMDWLGEDGTLVSFEYSNRKASYSGEKLVSGGQVVSVDEASGVVKLEMFIKDEAGDNTSPGFATVRLSPA